MKRIAVEWAGLAWACAFTATLWAILISAYLALRALR